MMNSSQALTTGETGRGFKVILICVMPMQDTKFDGLFFYGKKEVTEKGAALAYLKQHGQNKVTFEVDQYLPLVDEDMVESTPEGYRALWISLEHENEGYLVTFLRNFPSDIFGRGRNPEQLLEDLHKKVEKRMRTSATMSRSNTLASTVISMDATKDATKDTSAATAGNGTGVAEREGEVRLITQITQLIHGGLFKPFAASRSASPSSQPFQTTSSCASSLLSPSSPPSLPGFGEVANDSRTIQFDDSDTQLAMSPSPSGTSITTSTSGTGWSAQVLSLEEPMLEPFLKRRRGWTSKS
ncbi:hypothetical protein BT69DRAFT_1285771 [Atractiella rhizophila]|nr:hypothetical protein BT69DRAFT_1285771 [Atractiella rhizophila]